MPEILRLLKDQFETPLGRAMIAVDHQGNLRALDWADYTDRMLNLLRLHYGRNGFYLEKGRNPDGISDTLTSYFAGELSSIDTVPTLTSGTPFQTEVWRSLRGIPCGLTISYGQLAERIGRPNAARAVGLANGSNPISIVVPCHRVIGSGGSLTGYGGGIERKRWLLHHEQEHSERIDERSLMLNLRLP